MKDLPLSIASVISLNCAFSAFASPPFVVFLDVVGWLVSFFLLAFLVFLAFSSASALAPRRVLSLVSVQLSSSLKLRLDLGPRPPPRVLPEPLPELALLYLVFWGQLDEKCLSLVQMKHLGGSKVGYGGPWFQLIAWSLSTFLLSGSLVFLRKFVLAL